MSNSINEYCSSKLYIWCNELDPARVTELLGIEAHETWRKGERVGITDTQGHIRTLDRIHKRGCWYRGIDQEMKSWDLESQLEFWCDLLHKRESAVRALQALGCEVVIDSYISVGPILYIKLSPNLLKMLGDLGVELTCGIYNGSAMNA